ncbi:MAG: hypothetical protein FJ147_13630 [Deltaproteobacteria bacterium]|nr:hypothetical protein [Deltaproteobacteria bacterium]
MRRSSALFPCQRVGLQLLLALLLATLPQRVVAQTSNCSVFPADNIWNTPIDTLPVHPSSTTYINAVGATNGLHPDFGTVWNGAPNGIPFIVVPSTQPLVPVVYTAYGSESDPGPMPIPASAPIEGGPSSTGDRHVLVVQLGTCKLYELFYAFPQADGSWRAASGAVWNLGSHALRRDGWTSADAAGLPMFPGLVRYDEVLSGNINHALRFTVSKTQAAHLWPARHHTSQQGTQYPPMGLRFRLKASFNISSFSAKNQVILRALKKYGMFVSDNGSSWYLSGAPDSRWNDGELHDLHRIKGSDFEAVDESSLRIAVDSGQAKQGGTTPAPCTTTPDPAALNTPLANATLSIGPVPIDWADTSCATSYNVTVRRSLRRKTTVYSQTGLTVSQGVIPTLPSGTYYWSVSACNSFGCRSSVSRAFTLQ